VGRWVGWLIGRWVVVCAVLGSDVWVEVVVLRSGGTGARRAELQ